MNHIILSVVNTTTILLSRVYKKGVIVYEYVYAVSVEAFPDMLVYYGTDNPTMPTHATVTLDDTTSKYLSCLIMAILFFVNKKSLSISLMMYLQTLL